MNHIALPNQVLDNIELPSYELHTRPCSDNGRKHSVFYGSRLIGSIYVNYGISGHSNYVGATLDHQSFGPYSRRVEAAEAVLEAFTSGLTDQQRVMVAMPEGRSSTIANEIAENMTVIAC